MRRWTAALALTVVSPLAAQLREVRPAHTAVAFGWSDITGYGTALALLHRLPHAPVGLGVAAGGGGVGANAQVQLPDPFLPRRADHERSEERRVGKSVDLGGRRIIKKKKKKA